MQQHWGVWTNRSAQVFTTVRSQPSWVVLAALAAGILVFLTVAAILIIPAIIVGIVVFLVATLVARAQAGLAGLFGSRQRGRRNVRVMTHDASSR